MHASSRHMQYLNHLSCRLHAGSLNVRQGPGCHAAQLTFSYKPLTTSPICLIVSNAVVWSGCD